MYLYFDRTGVLKEIINDESLRQGNYGINKMYIYIENRNYTSIDVSYVNSEGTIIGSQNYNTFTNPSVTTPAENCYIPYNPERDLKYFKYWTPYKFLIIDLEATVTESNDTEVVLGPGPLDVPGIVHCSLSATLENSAILQLGDVNFKVQPSPGLNNEVAPEHYLSLSNYLYLQSELNKITNSPVEFNGTATFNDPVYFNARILGSQSSGLQLIDSSEENSTLNIFDSSIQIGSDDIYLSGNTILHGNIIHNVGDGEVLIKDDENHTYLYDLPLANGTLALQEWAQQKLYRHTVILRTSNYIMTKIVFLSSKEEDYTFAEIKELVAGDDIYQLYPEVSTSGDTLQYIATNSLTVSNDKLYNIRILFGESITKSMTELVDIYSQTVEEL